MSTKDRILAWLRSNQGYPYRTTQGSVYYSLAKRLDHADTTPWQVNGRPPRRAERLAFANAARRLYFVFGLDAETLARMPGKYAKGGDADKWRELSDKTYRSSHGTGDAARASYQRAAWRLWHFVFDVNRKMSPSPKVSW